MSLPWDLRPSNCTNGPEFPGILQGNRVDLAERDDKQHSLTLGNSLA